MSYLETIKKLNESVKNNPDISEEEKAKAKELLNELSRVLALY